MVTYTAQFLIGRSHPERGGFMPSHQLFVSENDYPTLILTHLETYQKWVWIPTVENALEDAFVMIHAIVLENETVLEQLQRQQPNFLIKTENWLELYDISDADRVQLYRSLKPELGQTFDCQVVISILDDSSLIRGVRPETVNQYGVNVKILNLLVPDFTRQELIFEPSLINSRRKMDTSRFMTWFEAIKRVLTEARKPMHYGDIADIIIDRQYVKTQGATPARTVSEVITTEIKRNGQTSIFFRIGRGVYAMRSQLDSSLYLPNVLTEYTASGEDVESDDALNDIPDLIQCFGMYWERDCVNWQLPSPPLFGLSEGADVKVDFAKQTGIYLLHDRREIVYVGKAGSNSLASRLKSHTKNRLRGRWNRFSWFGLRDVNDDGTLRVCFEI